MSSWDDPESSTVIEVPLKVGDQTLEIDCSNLSEDITELSEIFTSEEVDTKYWVKFAVSSQATRHITKGTV